MSSAAGHHGIPARGQSLRDPGGAAVAATSVGEDVQLSQQPVECLLEFWENIVLYCFYETLKFCNIANDSALVKLPHT